MRQLPGQPAGLWSAARGGSGAASPGTAAGGAPACVQPPPAQEAGDAASCAPAAAGQASGAPRGESRVRLRGQASTGARLQRAQAPPAAAGQRQRGRRRRGACSGSRPGPSLRRASRPEQRRAGSRARARPRPRAGPRAPGARAAAASALPGLHAGMWSGRPGCRTHLQRHILAPPVCQQAVHLAQSRSQWSCAVPDCHKQACAAHRVPASSLGPGGPGLPHNALALTAASPLHAACDPAGCCGRLSAAAKHGGGCRRRTGCGITQPRQPCGEEAAAPERGTPSAHDP